MTDPTTGASAGEEDIRKTFGADAEQADQPVRGRRERARFCPWHLPVKQVVRDHQWAKLTLRLIEENPPEQDTLRYFTLPGADLFDVRVLSGVCQPRGVIIEYFGFDASAGEGAREVGIASAGGTAGAALRQSRRVTDGSVVMVDQLEDVVLADSQAAKELRKRPPFHVVNIDACKHLTYSPPSRHNTTYQALNRLMQHQVGAETPWLLFLTTRVDPSLMADEPGIAINRAILENLDLARESFGAALAAAIDADPGHLTTALHEAWGVHDTRFLKLFSIGLGKVLLQFFYMQYNFPGDVELASAYAYRVHAAEPDMLALAFRIRPRDAQFFSPGVRGVARWSDMEPAHAIRIAERAMRLQDLDRELQADHGLREAAHHSTRELLRTADYDVEEWERWVAENPRPRLIETVSPG